MTTPGGGRPTLGDSCLQQTSCARPTDLSHGVGAPTDRAPIFCANRNICNFVWYGVGAGEGLRSDGVDDLPLSKSGCSIPPIARHLSGWGPTGLRRPFRALPHPDATVFLMYIRVTA